MAGFRARFVGALHWWVSPVARPGQRDPLEVADRSPAGSDENFLNNTFVKYFRAGKKLWF